MTNAEARMEGVKEFRAYMEEQGQFLASEFPGDADMLAVHHEVFLAFWAAIEAANPVGLRAPCVTGEDEDEVEDEDEGKGVHLDWSRGRAWLWFSVWRSGKCGIVYRNFETDAEIIVVWPSLTEALPLCLDVVCKHLESTVGR